jgi:hypothetical protein
MGMFEEVYCYAELPDGRDPRGTCFQISGFVHVPLSDHQRRTPDRSPTDRDE